MKEETYKGENIVELAKNLGFTYGAKVAEVLLKPPVEDPLHPDTSKEKKRRKEIARAKTKARMEEICKAKQKQ